MDKTEEFIQKAKAKHGNKYDYTVTEYVSSKLPVLIKCPKHGIFSQSPSNHLRTFGCQQCVTELELANNIANFIERARAVHGDKYDYSNLNYIHSEKHVTIGCPIHGEFRQTAQSHIYDGYGCPECGKDKVIEYSNNIVNKYAELFVAKAEKIHGDKYDYSKSVYSGDHQLISIICKIHGEFRQSPSTHLNGSGCSQCAIDNNRLTIAEFIDKANIVHHNFYDYSLVQYTNAISKVVIICPKHGCFSQRAITHLEGHGCKQCAIDAVTSDTLTFVNKAQRIHKGKYSYQRANYIRSSERVIITCPLHGDFEQIANNHTNGGGCPQCWQTISRQQQSVADFIIDNGFNVVQNTRNIINPLEIDIWIPEHFGIEFHGIRHHSADSAKRDKFLKYRNRRKALLAADHKITILQIFSHEWEHKRDIWESMIKHRLGLSKRVYARKLQLVQLNAPAERKFFDRNHIQGYNSSHKCCALSDGTNILIAMSFINRKQYWEIQRLASVLNHTIVGGASKLFQYFLKDTNPSRIITYADLRYSYGACYRNLGFQLIGPTQPNYKYVNNTGTKVLSRHKCQKHKLSELPNFDDTLTEAENMFNNGYRRLWDAGNLKFERT